jgi:hypothetical protein
MPSEHTKTPWHATQYSDKSWGVRNDILSIALIVEQDMENRDNGEERANAEFIARACNHHEELHRLLGVAHARLTELLLSKVEPVTGTLFDVKLLGCMESLLSKLEAEND